MSEWISVEERLPEPPVAVAENATTNCFRNGNGSQGGMTMRLIDADMLIAFLKKLGRLLKVEENHKRECRLIGNIINYIEKRAAINPADLVPVVRCNECEHRGKDAWCAYVDEDDNFFCGRGERRDDDAGSIS